ncbi:MULTISPECIES: hypothetical protein [Streptomyces]|uniref:hypothetical protein n=1 Tax=Streptomyces TaxID=1883 RepID=UPI001164B3E6|nr:MULTISPECIES: hypothetical protein [unclassified Streptomyces]NMI58997.1 hypothetical protein [Streptomyces sp. RLA2-12]QDN58283.1 hypothetical protein FNV67_25810 [Streptomyces sp. S1D4-20]QDN68377.1 hypothetical protein FNV66_25000 [Streptomyces sp. S1D4-14]QDO50796.1 hypothetical protein FNV60_23265 [Streptomyces sp. RLB3-5]QDO61034.1 hypothetical protein FNV59_25505 [Streptomyces sp. RLB1-8]
MSPLRSRLDSRKCLVENRICLFGSLLHVHARFFPLPDDAVFGIPHLDISRESAATAINLLFNATSPVSLVAYPGCSATIAAIFRADGTIDQPRTSSDSRQ